MSTSPDCAVICYTRPHDAEPIDTLVLRTWRAELSLSGADSESRATFERFRAWAAREGVSICPHSRQ